MRSHAVSTTLRHDATAHMTHRSQDRYDRRQHDTCTQNDIDDQTEYELARQRTVAKPNTSQLAAFVLPAPEPPLEPGTITAPGSTHRHVSTLAQHRVHMQTKAIQNMQLRRVRLPICYTYGEPDPAYPHRHDRPCIPSTRHPPARGHIASLPPTASDPLLPMIQSTASDPLLPIHCF